MAIQVPKEDALAQVVNTSLGREQPAKTCSKNQAAHNKEPMNAMDNELRNRGLPLDSKNLQEFNKQRTSCMERGVDFRLVKGPKQKYEDREDQDIARGQ